VTSSAATDRAGYLVNTAYSIAPCGITDADKYLAVLKRAQMDIDLHPERHKHHHLQSVPEKHRDTVDVRAGGVQRDTALG
jgi:hypothetical protein